MADKYIVVDKIKWRIMEQNGIRTPQPICPTHFLRMRPKPEKYNLRGSWIDRLESTALRIQCAEGPHTLNIPRSYSEELRYVIDRIDALVFAKVTYMYLDDVAIPMASDEIKDKDSPIWVKAKVTESKSGLRLIVWAGDRSKKNKTQLFIEPELKRMSFDQNDDHPLEVFAKVEATFVDGVSTKIGKTGE